MTTETTPSLWALREVLTYLEDGPLGSFKRHFFDALVAADINNRDLLAKGFPIEVDAWMWYQRNGIYNLRDVVRDG